MSYMATKHYSGETPKYQQIYEAIRQRILNRKWQPGERLPPARVFAEEFAVTPVTIWKAFDALSQENLIVRVQGKGSFVSDTAGQPQPGLTGLIMPTDGHCYGALFHQLVHAISERNGHTAVGSIGPEQGCTEAERVRSLEQFLTRDLDGLIVDGRVVTPFATLAARYPNGRGLTFIHRYETRQHLPEANFILTAWDVGGEAAARHLLSTGIRRLVLFTFGELRGGVAQMGDSVHYHWQLREGIERAIAAHGGDPARDLRVVVDAAGADGESQLREALDDGFCGVICVSDHRASKVYRLAAKMGLRVGRDVRVSGFFDTPWARNLHPTLTSVNVQQSRLAELAAECVAEGWHGRRLTVPPVLMPRESTGAWADTDRIARPHALS